MTDTKNTVSDELLADLIREAANEDWEDLVLALTELQSLRASIPGDVGVKLEALAYDWEYIDPKTGHWSYARTPDRANHLQAQGVKLTPVYTIEVVRQAQSALDLSPAEGEPSWFAVQSVTGSHIGLWRDEQIARRVFEQEYPNGALIPLYSAPSNPVVSDEWQPIGTAPKDGTVVLAVTVEAQKPEVRVSWFEGGRWVRIWKPEKFVVSGPTGWWPTHWVPLPAAPAALSVKPQSGETR